MLRVSLLSDESAAASSMGADRFIITGAGGMLGTALVARLSERGAAFDAYTHAELDVTDRNSVREAIQSAGTYAILLNFAAYTDVEKAESEPDVAFSVNESGARILAEECVAADVDLVHVSTDFVFDGTKGAPYIETDEPNPLSVYGASKLAGEEAVCATMPDALIVRTAWVFGAGGENFITKVLRRMRKQGEAQVVNDEMGCPTHTGDLARCLLELVAAGNTGIYHLAGAGECTRYELAVEAASIVGIEAEIAPVSSDLFQTGAARPKDSRLDCSKAAAQGVAMRPWREALAEYLEAVTAEA